jgi:hypothetical protein
MWECEMDSSGSGYGLVTRFYEHGNESLGSIKRDEFSDWAFQEGLCSICNAIHMFRRNQGERKQLFLLITAARYVVSVT